jgi:hypothetical protein
MQTGLLYKPVCTEAIMKDSADRMIQRTQTYWYSDGLAEIGFSIICLVLSAYFYGQATLAPGSLLFRMLDVGFLLILVGSGLIVRKLVTNLKTRVTYPRTGYVSYKQPKLAQHLGTIISGIVISSIMVLIYNKWDHIEALMPAATGTLVGAALIFFAYRSKILRFYLLAVISLLVGGVLSLSGLGDMMGLSYYYGLMALVLLIFGLTVLRDYLVNTQPLEG